MSDDKNTKGYARAGTAVRKRGKARVSDILTAAQNILVRTGLANLTTRSVADELGISLGNLAYYFPSKDALLQAIIENVIEGYDKEFQRKIESFPDNPEERLKAFLRYLIDDAKKPEVQSFFYQFWGLATHHPQAAKSRAAMYKHFSSQTLFLLRDVHPNTQSEELENMSFGLLASIEGLHVIFGSGDIERIHSAEFDDYIYRQLMNMAGIDSGPMK